MSSDSLNFALVPPISSSLILLLTRLLTSHNTNLVDVSRISVQGLDSFGRVVQLVGGQVVAEVQLVDAVMDVAAAGQPVRLEGGDDGFADVLVALVLENEDSVQMDNK